jgi:hypothetical protein
MKTLTLLLALTAFVVSAQTIRIADNNANAPSGTNIYTLVNASPNPLQKALDDSAPGDIVFVQPSLTSYGDVNIDKRITLRGIGFNTGKDLANQSMVNIITLSNTASNFTNASGSIIEGINGSVIYLGFRTGSFSYTLQNITIRKCRWNYILRSPSGNFVVANNVTIANSEIGVINFVGGPATSQFLIYGNRFFGQGLVFGPVAQIPGIGNPITGFSQSPGSISGYIISNNIFGFAGYLELGGIGNNLNNGSFSANAVMVANNIFLGNPASQSALGGVITDFSFANNIFYGRLPRPTNAHFAGSFAFGRNSFTNNITFNVSDPLLPPISTGGNTNTGSSNKETKPLSTGSR